MVVLALYICAFWFINTPLSLHCSSDTKYTPQYHGIPCSVSALSIKVAKTHCRIERKVRSGTISLALISVYLHYSFEIADYSHSINE